MKSNIFYTSSTSDDRIEKAEELARIILLASKNYELNDNSKLIVYTNTSEFIHDRDILTMVNSKSLGTLLFTRTTKDSYYTFKVLLNFDQIVSDVIEGDTSRLSGLHANLSITNIFIYALLYEIGRYNHYKEVKAKGLINELTALNNIYYKILDDRPGDDKYTFLSVEELYAENFACRNMYEVISGLESLNPKYLAYLD